MSFVPQNLGQLPNAVITEAGSQFSEGFRDDISAIFSRDKGVESIASLINHASINGTVVANSVQGQAQFSVPATAGSTCYFNTITKVLYEAGHMIGSDQTVEISAQPTGDGKIEWGLGEDNGSGGILNGIGYGYDAVGLYVFRIKLGVYANKVYQPNFNLDKLNGLPPSNFTVNNVPVPINVLNNNVYKIFFGWYGIAPIRYMVENPLGNPLEVHTEETAGQQTGTTIPEPQLSSFMRIQNDSITGQAITVMSGCWKAGIFTSRNAISVVSVINSYYAPPSVPLGANQSYVGAFENLSPYAQVDVSSIADVDGVLTLEGSNDGVNVLSSIPFPTSSGIVNFIGVFNFQFIRFNYVNGATPQTAWTLQTLLRVQNAGQNIFSLENNLTKDSITSTVRAVVSAKNKTGNGYSNVQFGQKTKDNSLPVVIASDQTPVPVSGTVTVDTSLLATSAKQDTGNASLSSIDSKSSTTNTVLSNILSELQNSVAFSETVWYDAISSAPTVLWYVRVVTVDQTTGTQTITWKDINGNPATPVIANLQQVTTSADYEFNTVAYRAIIGGTGYSINDRIQKLQIINMVTTTLVATIWNNETTGLILGTPPTFSNLVVDDSYATSANQVLELTALGTLLTTTDFDTKTGSLTETAPATDTASSGLNGRLQRIAQRITSLITALGSPFQAGGSIGNTAFVANAGTNLNTSALNLETTQALIKAKTDNLDVALSTRLSKADFEARVNTLGQKTSANSTPIVIASDQSAVPVTPSVVATSTLTNVTASTTSANLVASNSSRKGLSIYNDAGRNIYVKFGSTASTTSFTMRMSDNTYYEMPQPIYTGTIDVITSSGSGSVRVTELT